MGWARFIDDSDRHSKTAGEPVEKAKEAFGYRSIRPARLA
jgi:hypothetical protein